MQVETERIPQNEAGAPHEEASPQAGVLNGTYRMARRIGVAIVGSTVLLLGVVLLVTPGPAFIVIPIGLGILSIEFAWARRWLKKLKQGAAKVIGSRKESAA